MSRDHEKVLVSRIRSDSTNTDIHTPLIDYNEIKFIEHIGEGSFGNVSKGKCRETFVALKTLPLPESSESYEQIFNEMKILTMIRHPKVVLYLGCCIDKVKREIVIVSELCKYDLTMHMSLNGPFTLMECIKLGSDIADGMAWLHAFDPAILHSDLKPENVLIDNYGNAKVMWCIVLIVDL